MAQPVRDEKGRIVAGSLNPGGRPKLPAEVREAAQAASPRALAKVIEFLDNADPRIALAAAQVILDRGYGKPVQAIDARVEQIESTADAHVRALVELANKARLQQPASPPWGSSPQGDEHR